jgi:peptidoglycan/LPS O-acetylase OafA/YrhL
MAHLDGLRGVAAISVVLYHIDNLFGVKLGFERAYLFVDVFFVLSGFVLSRAWADASERDMASRTLFKARVCRLWPMIALGTLIGASVHLILNDVPEVFSTLVLALLLIPFASQSGPVFPLNGPQWSIFWELFANLVHIRWLRRVHAAKLLSLSLILAAFVFLAIGFAGGNTVGPNADLWWMGGARVAWSYTVGMLIAAGQRKAMRRPLLVWWQSIALFMITMLFLPLVPLSTAAGDIVFTLLVGPALFWLLITAKPPRASTRWPSRLGALSFPLYALHLPVLTACVALSMPKGEAATLGFIASLCLAACFSPPKDGGSTKPRSILSYGPLKV